MLSAGQLRVFVSWGSKRLKGSTSRDRGNTLTPFPSPQKPRAPLDVIHDGHDHMLVPDLGHDRHRLHAGVLRPAALRAHGVELVDRGALCLRRLGMGEAVRGHDELARVGAKRSAHEITLGKSHRSREQQRDEEAEHRAEVVQGGGEVCMYDESLRGLTVKMASRARKPCVTPRHPLGTRQGTLATACRALRRIIGPDSLYPLNQVNLQVFLNDATPISFAASAPSCVFQSLGRTSGSRHVPRLNLKPSAFFPCSRCTWVQERNKECVVSPGRAAHSAKTVLGTSLTLMKSTAITTWRASAGCVNCTNPPGLKRWTRPPKPANA
jgi:hypothetical protein